MKAEIYNQVEGMFERWILANMEDFEHCDEIVFSQSLAVES